MNTETIGLNAGLVWAALNEAQTLDTKQIKKMAKLKNEKEVYAAAAGGISADNEQTIPTYEDILDLPVEAIAAADYRTISGVNCIYVETEEDSEGYVLRYWVSVETGLLTVSEQLLDGEPERREEYLSIVGRRLEELEELLQYLVEPSDLLRGEAEALLAGIVLDTKNFNMRAGSRTFEAAAFLRRAGADPSEVRRYFQSDLDSMIQRYGIIRSAEMVHGDIALAVAEQEVSRVTAAKAADDLLNIQGIQASIVLYRQGDGVSMSARSLGEINVQVILEALGGGGNSATAGGRRGRVGIVGIDGLVDLSAVLVGGGKVGHSGLQLGHSGEAPQVGKGGAQEGGHLKLGAHMEKQGAHAGKEQGGLDGQGQSVALDQNGHQHGGPKHGKHVLKAQNQHLGQAQLPGVADGLVVVHFVLLSLTHKKRRFPMNRQQQIEARAPSRVR